MPDFFFFSPQVLKKNFEQICFINILSLAVFRYGNIQFQYVPMEL